MDGRRHRRVFAVADRARPGVDRPTAHLDSIDFVREPALVGTHPLYAAHNVLVSSRHQDCVLVVDWDRQVVLWQWVQDAL